MEYTLPQLLKALLDQGASDLHISINTSPRLRIDGSLVALKLPPLTPKDTQDLCLSILTEQQKKRLEQEKELDLAFSVKGLARFRANVYYEKGAVAAAFRVIPFKIYSIDELNLPPVIKKIADTPRGLVLVTGPTGSGKSTTLSSLINYINETRFDHIVTIEDPIEFLHPHKNCVVNQREIGDDTANFPRALKSILRQDPDVVLVGELRDLETMAAAISIAETGHLVFASLHTNNCVSSLNRIIDSFPASQQSQIRTQLAMTLEAVVSQILLPANGGGRVMAMEIMRSTTAIRALINEGKFHQIYSTMQTNQEETGMITLNQSLAKLVERGFIDRNLALSKASNYDELLHLLTKKDLGSAKSRSA